MMTLQEWIIYTEQDRKEAIKAFLDRRFIEDSMSDWRKILVAYIQYVKARDEGQSSDAISRLTNAERESLLAAMREAGCDK
jgi:formate dehydrogenase maturation protein FdhE